MIPPVGSATGSFQSKRMLVTVQDAFGMLATPCWSAMSIQFPTTPWWSSASSVWMPPTPINRDGFAFFRRSTSYVLARFISTTGCRVFAEAVEAIDPRSGR